MDYRYIEQLLERYWECQTTREEEAILRTFFRQEDVPASLLPYRQLFLEEDAMAGERLPEGFAEEMLRLVEGEQPQVVCRARRLTFMRRIRPLYQAAGLVALLLSIGNAAQQSMTADDAAQEAQMAQAASADTLQQHIAIGTSETQPAPIPAVPCDSLSACN